MREPSFPRMTHSARKEEENRQNLKFNLKVGFKLMGQKSKIFRQRNPRLPFSFHHQVP